MELAGWGVAMALLAVFVILSFKTWIVWWHERDEDAERRERRQEMLDDLPPLTNGRRPR